MRDGSLSCHIETRRHTLRARADLFSESSSLPRDRGEYLISAPYATGTVLGPAEQPGEPEGVAPKGELTAEEVAPLAGEVVEQAQRGLLDGFPRVGRERYAGP